jgi:hypothetical protein
MACDAERYKDKVMGIHSTILVHWTGKKDIECEPENIRPESYLERLIDYYQNGLFAKRVTEGTIRKWKIKNIIRICFTEIRLSQAQTHAKRYGKLGIGFARDFILNKGGRPVIYIPHTANEDSRLLEDSIKNVYEKSKDNKDNKEVHKSSKWIMAHVKRMSNGKSEDYYEEMEWRLVYDESPNHKHFTKGKGKDIFRVKFKASDIKVIIFPDEDIKQIISKNKIIRKFFSEHMPIMATLDDCCNF